MMTLKQHRRLAQLFNAHVNRDVVDGARVSDKAELGYLEAVAALEKCVGLLGDAREWGFVRVPAVDAFLKELGVEP